MTILGLNYIFHDSAACIVKDGELQFAIEEERLNRQKHTQSFPELAVRACLDQTNTHPHEVEHIAVSTSPGKSDELKLAYAASLGSANHNFPEL